MAWWLFQNLVVTAALVAAVALFCRFGRIGPVARHALWVLVLLKFITPPIVVWPWAAPDPLGLAAVQTPVLSHEPVPVQTLTELPIVDTAPALIGSEAASRSVVSGQTAPDLVFWLVAFWISGSVVLLGLEFVRLVRLGRRVRVAGPADRAVTNRVAELSAQLGVRNRLAVKELHGSSSPVVWCFGRPVLLWPADLPADATDACIDGLIVHELAHIKRRDHFVGWIELVAGVVWWWNPLFWFVRSALREQAELACDAWVISALPNGRRAYAESLLTLSSIAGPSSMSKSMAAVIGVRASSRRVLERRLVMIMKGRAPLRLPSVGVFTLAVVAAATLPAWATADQQAQQQPKAPQVHQEQAYPQPRAAQAHQERSHATQAQGGQHQQMAAHAQQPTPAAPVPQAREVIVHRATPAPQVITHELVARPIAGHEVVVQPTPQTAQPKPTTGQQVHIVQRKGDQPVVNWISNTKSLPEDAQKALTTYETDREAIEREIDAKLEARRVAVTKELEALQERYTKAGKLDEAVAIRDYLRAGGPSLKHQWIIKR